MITFPYTNLGGSKRRAAVIIANSLPDLTVGFITTQPAWRKATDVLINPTFSNGLQNILLIRTGKIATCDRALTEGLPGNL